MSFFKQKILTVLKSLQRFYICLQSLAFLCIFCLQASPLSAADVSQKEGFVEGEAYHPSLALLAKENQESSRTIEELALRLEKVGRELSGLEIRLTDIAKSDEVSPGALHRLDLYLKNPQLSIEPRHVAASTSSSIHPLEPEEAIELTIDSMGSDCGEFIKTHEKILSQEVEPQMRALRQQLLELTQARKEWGEQQPEKSVQRLFIELSQHELDLKITYLERQLKHLSAQKDYATALAVYEECIEQCFSPYAASDSSGVQLKEKIQQRLHFPHREVSARKQIGDWTNETIQSRRTFREAIANFKQAFPNDSDAELSSAGDEIKRWIEKNRRILHQIAKDEECLEQTIGRCKNLVMQHCLWMQDSLPLTSYFKKSLGQEFVQLFLDLFKEIQSLKVADFLFFSLLTLLFDFLLLIFLRHWIKSASAVLLSIEEKLGRVTKDSIFLTLQAMLWQALNASFWPSILAAPFLTLWLLSSETSGWFMMAIAGLRASLLFYALWFLKRLAGPQGIFETHLRLSKKKLKLVFSGWTFQSTLLCLSYFCFQFFLLHPLEQLEGLPELARIGFIGMVLCTIAIKWRLARASVPPLAWGGTLGKSSYFNRTYWMICIAVASYTAFEAFKGFFETAKTIFWCLEKLTFTLAFLLLAYQLIVRMMLIHRRRISFERNLQRRSELLEQVSKKGAGESEEQLLQESDAVVDLEMLSSRALSLLRSITQISSLAIFWFICPELQPMLSRLDVVVIAPNATLFGILKFSIWLFLFYQFYKDLPSALDLLVFPHFKLTQNTRYTIKLLTRYAVFSMGVMFFYNQINGQANESLKMVGTLVIGALGFGIRDIFNSAISGIIILTVKTIQVGDTVNIGEITGVVTQVTILSTIVIDAEKKEFSIPNKNLINELFSRWPSDDLVNRIAFKISVPSRCSPETVFKVLKEASQSIAGVAKSSDENTSITGIARGILTYELILLVEDLQHQALIKTSLYEQILKRAQSLGLSQDEISIQS